MHIIITRKPAVSIETFFHTEGDKKSSRSIMARGDFFVRDVDYSSEECSGDIAGLVCSKGLDTLHGAVDGAYDLVVVDREKNIVSVTSDPYGLNRIYYRLTDDRLELADSVAPLAVGGGRISRDGLAEYLRFLDISSPVTILDGIKCLDGGEILTYKGDNDSISITQRVKEGAFSFRKPESLKDAVDALEDLLRESLDHRIGGNKRTGLLLSGGIDSGLLAAVYAKTSRFRDTGCLTCYTVGFHDDSLDESAIAEKIAAHLGVGHTTLKFSVEEEVEAFDFLTSNLEIPFADPAVIPTILALKRMKKDGIESVMEGTGADGLIGYKTSKYHARILDYCSKVPGSLRKCAASVLKLAGNPGGYLPYFDFDEPQVKFIRWHGWTRQEIDRLCGGRCDFADTAFYKTFEEYRDSGVNELYRQLMISMPDYRITESVKLFGLSPAFPFFDQKLRCYVEDLPYEYKFSGGKSKVLYRELLGKFVPQSLWDIPKHGFDYPFEKLLSHDGYNLVRTYLDSGLLSDHGLFDKSVVDEYVSRFMTGDFSVRFKVWALVVFQAWYERYYRSL